MRSSYLNRSTRMAVALRPFLGVALCVLLAALVAGCTPAPIAIVRPLDMPPRPVLPMVLEAEMTCLSDDAYKRLIERDRLRREHAETLEAIIQSTHGEKRD